MAIVNNVKISCATEGATIHYKLKVFEEPYEVTEDDPITENNSPISINTDDWNVGAPIYIFAKAFKEGMQPSDLASAYTNNVSTGTGGAN